MPEQSKPKRAFRRGWRTTHVGPTKRGGDGRRRLRFPRFKFRGVLPYVGLVALAGVVVAVGAFAWFSRDLPDPDKLLERRVAQSTKIYARDGTTVLYEIHGDQKRSLVTLDDIPDYVEHATIAIEDKNFYEHGGFDLRGILRSVFQNVVRLDPTAQGGSTITQQFVKNAILTTEESYIRKVRELILSYQIERKFSKDQILQLYLNEIPYGGAAYGVESAARTYFGKGITEVTVAEAALLAALPQAPSYYSPFGSHTDELYARAHLVLDLMVEQGYLTSDEAEAAKTEEITFSTIGDAIAAPHFVLYVKQLLADTYGEKVIEQNGLSVITTLDADKQRFAEEAVAAQADTNESRWGAGNAALVALDPKTGEILAMVGSRDFFDDTNDGQVNVTIRPRQPGSSFKPVVYATAFERGYTPETMLFDLVTDFETGEGKPYTPHNYDSREHGPISMARALAGSLNIPAVKTLYLAGVDNVLDQAEKLGYTTFTDRSRFGLSLVLGGGEVTLLEHTGAFAALAREGFWQPPQAILRVLDAGGSVLEEYKPETPKDDDRALDQHAAQEINQILSNNDLRSFIFGSANRLTLPDRPVAAKTGTTNDYRDAWTLGYTPSLAAGVWVGNNDNSEMKRGADGSVVAAPIWNAFMKAALTGTPVESFHEPPDDPVEKGVLAGQIDELVTRTVDRGTGRVIPDSCLADYPEAYQTTRTFKVTHTILHYVAKDDPRGSAPERPDDDPQYAAWEKEVAEWARSQGGYLSGDPPLEDCNLRGTSSTTVSFTAPAAGTIVTGDTLDATIAIAGSETPSTAEYFLDGNEIAESTTTPFGLHFNLSGTGNGLYTLSVRVTFASGRTTAAETTINVLRGATGLTRYLTAPSPGATLATGAFPITLAAVVHPPASVARVDFYSTTAASGSAPALIGSVSAPTASTISVLWATAPAPGVYSLSLTVTDTAQSTHPSDQVTVTVE